MKMGLKFMGKVMDGINKKIADYFNLEACFKTMMIIIAAIPY